MNVIDAIKARRSIRRYKPEPVSREDLLKLLEAARLAPSAGNRQPWRFIVVMNPERRRSLASASQGFVADAYAVIVALGDPKASRWFKQDPMIALEHIALEATELGLGTCWIGAFNEAEVKRILKVPEELSVIALMSIGVPAEQPSARSRKPIEEIVFMEEYGNPFKP